MSVRGCVDVCVYAGEGGGDATTDGPTGRRKKRAPSSGASGSWSGSGRAFFEIQTAL